MASHKQLANRNITLFLTHVKPEGKILKFYSLLESNVRIWKELEQLLQQNANELESTSTLPWTNPNVGDFLCCVKSPFKGQWCRARVRQFDASHAAVFLVDHGITEVVPKCNVRCADKDITSIPICTMECILADVAPFGEEWQQDVIRICEQGLLLQNLSGYIVCHYGNIPVIRLAKLGESEPFVQRLINNSLARIENFEVKSDVPQNNLKFSHIPLIAGKTQVVSVSFVYSPKLFYIQLISAEVELQKLMVAIEMVNSQGKLTCLTMCSVGLACLALHNSHYYRAVIQDIQQDVFKVLLVDYGSTLSKDYKELRAIPPQFLALPAQASVCSLKDAHLISVENFMKLTKQHRNFNCQILGQQGDIFLVHLLLNDQNILSSPPKVNQPLEFVTQPLMLNASLEVIASYVVDPHEFYCQISSCKQDIDIVATKLESACTFEPLNFSDIVPGLAVCALFSEDNLWYRAKVMKVLDLNNITVAFVDYGNVEEVKLQDIRMMPSYLITHSVHAYKFSLHEVEPVLPESDACQWFEDVATEENLRVEVKSHLKDNHYSVILYQDNQTESVNHKLIQKLAKAVPVLPAVSIIENVYISVFNAPVFFGQLTKFDLDTLVNLQRGLNANCKNSPQPCVKVNVGDYICAKFSQDNHFYRAVVESVVGTRCEVFLVDYGNHCSVGIQDIQQMSPKFASHPMFGIECILDNWPNEIPTEELGSLLLENEVQIQPMKKLGPAKWEVLFTESFAGNIPVLKAMNRSSRSNIPADKIIAKSNSNVVEEISVNSKFNRTDSLQLNGSAKVADPIEYKKIPILTGTFTEIYVSYVNNPSEFYCQLISDSTELQSLMKKMEGVYSKVKPTEMNLTKPEIGMPCSIFYEEDSMWYRAKIQSISGRQCQVIFVDYGNKQMTELAKLKVLLPEFFSLAPQAVQCVMFNIKSDTGKWSASDIAAFTTMAGEKSFISQFVQLDSKGVYSVNLFDINKLQDGVLSKDFVKSGHGQLLDASKLLVVNSLMASTSLAFVEQDVALTTHDVNITFVKNPLVFFCQLKSEFPAFKTMMAKVQDYYNHQSDNEDIIDRPHVGMICIAQFLEDGAWYRAKIVAVAKYGISVLYVDYGNEAVLTKGKVKYILQDFTTMPTQAIRCQFQGLKSPAKHLPDVFPKLFDGNSSCTFISKKTDHFEVSLMCNGKNVSKEIIALKLAVSDVLSKEDNTGIKITIANNIRSFQKDQLVTVIVTYIQSPTQFWCQVKDSAEMDEVTEKIETFYSGDTLEKLVKFSVNSYCVAKYALDDGWYRAQVKRIEGDMVDVQFIDYGNSETVHESKIREIVPDLISYPAQAIECRLYGLPSSYDTLLDTKFKDLLEAEEVTMKVENVSANKLSVTLYDQTDPENEVNVLQSIFGCEPAVEHAGDVSGYSPPEIPADSKMGYITHINDPGLFYVQLGDDEEVIEAFATKVYEHCTSDGNVLTVDELTVGMACCAKYSKDDEWYRAEIKSIQGDRIMILFVDYGNTDDLPPDMLRTAGDLIKTPTFAIPCCLAGFDPCGRSWKQEIIDEFNNLVLDAEINITFTNNTLPVSVRLVKDGVDLNEVLSNKECFSSAPVADSKTYDQKANGIACNRTIGIAKLSARICFAETTQKVFITAGEWIKDLDDLSVAMEETYGNPEQDSVYAVDEICIGQFYAAKYCVDEAWYRVVVTEIEVDNITTMFIDYGNTEVIRKDEMRLLKPEFTKDQPFAVECKLNSQPFEEKDGEIFVKLEALVSDAVDVVIDILSEVEPYVINIITTDGEFALSITEDGLSDKIQEDTGNTQQVVQVEGVAEDVAKDVEGLKSSNDIISEEGQKLDDRSSGVVSYLDRNLPEGKITVTISHVESAFEFYVTPVEVCNEVENLSATLQEQYADDDEKEALSANDIIVGRPCVAKYSEDGVWYRAVITSVDGDSVFIKFVDHGNSEMTSVSELKCLATELAIIPRFSIKCSLFGLYPKEGMEDAIFAKLQAFCDDFEEVTIEVQEHLESYFIKLNSNGDFLEQLLNEGLADAVSQSAVIPAIAKLDPDTEDLSSKLDTIPVTIEQDFNIGDLPLKSDVTHTSLELDSDIEGLPKKIDFIDRNISLGTAKAKISFVENWNAFYISAVSWSAEFLELKEQLDNLYTSGNCDVNVDDIELGQTCAVYSLDHEQWCRGLVEEVEGDNVGIQLVDYGISLNVQPADVKQLSTELLDIPKFAVKCMLFDLVPIRGTELDIVDKLQYLCDECVIFEMDVMGQCVPYPIKIKTDSDFLSELIEEGMALSPRADISFNSETFKDNLQFAFIDDHLDNAIKVVVPSRVLLDDVIVGTLQHIEVSNGTIFAYIVPANLVTLLDNFQAKLQAEYNDSTYAPMEVEVGDFCVAKFLDGSWYRVQVLKKIDESLLLKAIDYGSDEFVDLVHTRKLKPFQDPQYVFQCCLFGAIVAKDQEERVEELLWKYESDWKVRKCQISSHSVGNQNCIVTAEVADCDILDNLIQDGYVRQVFPMERDLKVFPCSVIRVDEDLVVYVVPHQYVEKRNLVQQALNSSCSFDSEVSAIENVNTSQLYAAVKDSVWYRISVISCSDTSAEAYLADFGTTHTFDIDDLQRLPVEFSHLSPLCLQCKILGLPDERDVDLRQQILKVVQDKRVTCAVLNAECCLDCTCYKIKLIVDEEDVLDCLQHPSAELLLHNAGESVGDADHEKHLAIQSLESPKIHDAVDSDIAHVQEKLNENCDQSLPEISGDVEDLELSTAQESFDKNCVQSLPETSGDVDDLELPTAQESFDKNRVQSLPETSGDVEDLELSTAQESFDKTCVQSLPETSGNVEDFELPDAQEDLQDDDENEGTSSPQKLKESLELPVQQTFKAVENEKEENSKDITQEDSVRTYITNVQQNFEENHEITPINESSYITENPELVTAQYDDKPAEIHTTKIQDNSENNQEISESNECLKLLDADANSMDKVVERNAMNTQQNFEENCELEFSDAVENVDLSTAKESEEDNLNSKANVLKSPENAVSHLVDTSENSEDCKVNVEVQSDVVNQYKEQDMDKNYVELPSMNETFDLNLQMDETSPNTATTESSNFEDCMDDEILSGVTKVDEACENVPLVSSDLSGDCIKEDTYVDLGRVLRKGHNIVSVEGIEIRDSSIFFAVILSDSKSDLVELQARLQNLYNDKTLADSGEVLLGPCAVLLKDIWYRAEVVCNDGDSAKVSFWDIYEEDQIIGLENIRKLDDSFVNQSKYLVWCTVPFLECFNTDAATSSLQQNLCGKDIEIEVLEQTTSCSIIQLVDHKAIQEVIENNHLVFSVLSPSVTIGNHQVKISHVDEGLSLLIYFQLVDQSQSLHELCEIMNTTYKEATPSISVEDAISGGLYAIKHCGKWERCTVLKNESTSIFFLVDSGICFEAKDSSFHPLNYGFVLESQYAYPCIVSSLSSVPEERITDVVNSLKLASDTEEMCVMFSEKDENGFYPVDLTISGLDINNWLKKQKVGLGMSSDTNEEKSVSIE